MIHERLMNIADGYNQQRILFQKIDKNINRTGIFRVGNYLDKMISFIILSR